MKVGCLRAVSSDVYALESIGTLQFDGLLWRSARACAGGCEWQLSRRGPLRLGRRFEALDVAGASVGTYAPRRWRDGGEVRWAQHKLDLLRGFPSWPMQLALQDDKRVLAVFGYRYDAGPTITWDQTVEPGLLLFVAFVARTLLRDAPTPD